MKSKTSTCIHAGLPETIVGVRAAFLNFACVISVALTACASLGSYVWVDDYREGPRQQSEYLIAPGDTIQVRVFNQEQLSTKAKVRGDGKVSLTLLNDVDAAGTTPVALAQKVEGMLKGFVKNPLVTVSIEETKPQMVFVTGEVPKPGAYPLEASPGILQAIVNAGGLGSEATADRIFVLRHDPEARRIRVTYHSLIHLSGAAASFRLKAGDVVVVE